MISRSRARQLFAILYSVAFVALGVGPLASDVSARGRSFPIEVTGTIISVDWRNFEFTLRVDEPARILVIGLRRDCKFVKSGTPAKMDILKKGAYVKVSYFATIFTGNLAVGVEANPPPQVTWGVIEKIDPATRTLTIRVNKSSHQLVVRCARNARFLKHGKACSLAELKESPSVKVIYYTPPFERNYAIKIEF